MRDGGPDRQTAERLLQFEDLRGDRGEVDLSDETGELSILKLCGRTRPSHRYSKRAVWVRVRRPSRGSVSSMTARAITSPAPVVAK